MIFANVAPSVWWRPHDNLMFQLATKRTRVAIELAQIKHNELVYATVYCVCVCVCAQLARVRVQARALVAQVALVTGNQETIYYFSLVRRNTTRLHVCVCVCVSSPLDDCAPSNNCNVVSVVVELEGGAHECHLIALASCGRLVSRRGVCSGIPHTRW